MQSHSVTFINGTFQKVSGNNSSILSPTKAQIGDWLCVISPNKITCTCEKNSQEGRFRLIYMISKNGFCKKTLKGPHQSEKTLKKYWVCKPNRFNFSGTISFTPGEFEKQKISFKELRSSD